MAVMEQISASAPDWRFDLIKLNLKNGSRTDLDWKGSLMWFYDMNNKGSLARGLLLQREPRGQTKDNFIKVLQDAFWCKLLM